MHRSAVFHCEPPADSSPSVGRRRARKSALAGLLILTFATCSPCAGAILVPAGAGTHPRIDFRTVILSPAAREGWVRVTAFFGFRVPEGDPPDQPLLWVLPVEGIPREVSAQAMSLSGFDRQFTHGSDLEGAFFSRVRAERTAASCLCASIAANGGLPAWYLLSRRWPPGGPSLTAVVPIQETAALELHRIEDVRVVRARDELERRSGALDARARAAIRRFSDACLIVVTVAPATSGPKAINKYARSGIRISYEAPLSGSDHEVFRFPLATTPQAAPPALTRIYVSSPWSCRAEINLPGNRISGGPPQAIVNAVLGAFGYSKQFRASRTRAEESVSISSVRTGCGGETVRAVCAFADLDGKMEVVFRSSAARALRVMMSAAGTVLYGLLWPLTALLYLAGLWAAVRAYFWMTLFPRPEALLRRTALIAALGPVLTPWFMLRFFRPPGALPSDGDETGALGVLSMEKYECLVRLVLWALLVCVNWAVIRWVAQLALWLRFE